MTLERPSIAVAAHVAVTIAAAIPLSLWLGGMTLVVAAVGAGGAVVALLAFATEPAAPHAVPAAGSADGRAAVSHAAHEMRSQMALVTLMVNRIEGEAARAVEQEVEALARLADQLADAASVSRA